MNTFLSKTNVGMIILCSLLCFSGCTKSIINIDLGDTPNNGTPDNNNNGSGNTKTSLVTFHATVESRNMTRSLSPMQKGIACLIYAYKSPISSMDDIAEYGLYVTSSAGILTGANGYKMYLPTGVYSFYAVSNNSYSTPAQFTDGISHTLVNGVDYLWANNKLQDINTEQVSQPITFLHSATQVVFEISTDPSLKLNQLVSATITPSTPGGTMNLSNGSITPASSYAAPVQMGINGTLAQYTMLPLSTTAPMKLVLNVLVNNETVARTYSVDVPVPNGELKSGDSYRFSAVIGTSSVSFSDVNVVSWTDVDETGKPLYPRQQQ